MVHETNIRKQLVVYIIGYLLSIARSADIRIVCAEAAGIAIGTKQTCLCIEQQLNAIKLIKSPCFVSICAFNGSGRFSLYP